MMMRIAAIALGAMLLAGCDKGGDKKTTAPANPAPAAAATTPPTTKPAAVYICPMDAGVTSDKPAKCPKCGMDLELKK